MLDEQLRIVARGQHLRHHLRQPCRRRHGEAAHGEPVAQQVVDAVAAEPAHARQVQRLAGIVGAGIGHEARCQILRSEFVEQPLGRAGMGGAARDALLEAGKRRGQCRHHTVAQRIAGVARVGVRFVLDPLDTLFPRDLFEVRARYGQQRARHQQLRIAQQAGAAVGGIHARQPGRPRTAQQLQQHGFSLVVQVVRRQQHGGAVGAAHVAERRVAPLAGRGFDAALALVHLHGAPVERHAQRGGRGRAMVAPGVGVRAQAVVDVEGGQRAAVRAHMRMREAQQHHRVEAAAEGDRDVRCTVRKM